MAVLTEAAQRIVLLEQTLQQLIQTHEVHAQQLNDVPDAQSATDDKIRQLTLNHEAEAKALREVMTAVQNISHRQEHQQTELTEAGRMAREALRSPTHVPPHADFESYEGPSSSSRSPNFTVDLPKYNGSNPNSFDHWKSRMERVLQAKKCLHTTDGFDWALLSLDGSALQHYERNKLTILTLDHLFDSLRERFVPRNEGFRIRYRLESLQMKGTVTSAPGLSG